MRQARVLFKGDEAGILAQLDDGSFIFQYHPSWIENEGKPAIAPVLPKTNELYRSPFLFPFFYNMLPEGPNKQIACKLNRIDDNDHFGLLLTIAKDDTIGAVTICKMEDQ